MTAEASQPEARQVTFQSELMELIDHGEVATLYHAAKTSPEAAKFLDEGLRAARVVLRVCRPTLTEFAALAPLDRAFLEIASSEEARP